MSHQRLCLLTLCAPRRAGGKFVPTPEERLLSVVHALLHRCYKLPFSNAAQVRSIPLVLSQLTAHCIIHPHARPSFWHCTPIAAGVQQSNSPALQQSRLDRPMEFVDV